MPDHQEPPLRKSLFDFTDEERAAAEKALGFAPGAFSHPPAEYIPIRDLVASSNLALVMFAILRKHLGTEFADEVRDALLARAAKLAQGDADDQKDAEIIDSFTRTVVSSIGSTTPAS